jgi:Tfp pilus assembly protein PilF/glycosyltransferase involved in cell wall biosynthesis
MQSRPNVYTQRGGDTIVLERLSDGLIARGHQVTIDVTGKANPADFDLVHLFNLATTAITWSYAEKAISADRPYVVTTLYEDIPSFHRQSHLVAAKAIQYVQGGQRPGSWSLSAQELSALTPAPRFLADDIVRGAAALLPNGAGEELALKRDFPSLKRSIVVPMGSEIGASAGPELFESVYGERDFVLCVGRLESRKNQLMLLKALEDSPLTVVLAAGSFSYQPQYEAAVRAFRRKGKTIILGLIDPQMLASAYAACRTHVLPSWYELPGLVSLEAAAQNKNIVVTRTGTTADYVGDRAFYCSPWDSDSILSAVTAAYFSPAREGLVDMARSYSWEASVAKTESVYQEVAVINKRVFIPKYKEESRREAETSENGENSMSQETSDFKEMVERGEIAAKASDFGTADKLLAQAEMIAPQSTRVMKARGAVLLAQMKPLEAMQFFDRALAIESKEPKLLAGRGMCDLLRNRPDTAICFFERALEVEPGYLVALHQLLECSYATGAYAKALWALTRYLQTKPTDTDIRFCLAGCLYKNGQIEAAQWELDIIERSDPEHVGARELRKVIIDGVPSSSDKIVTTAEPQLVPSEPGANIKASLAELSARIKSWKVDANAQATVETPSLPVKDSVSVLSDDIVAQAIGKIEDLKRSGEFSNAIDELAKLMAQGTLSDPYREIADCLAAEFTVLGGELDKASIMYDEILGRKSTSARALCGKGALAAEAQNWAAASGYFTQALAADGENDVAYAGMGICAMAENNTDKAFGFFQAATDRNPENHRALLGLLQTGYPLKRYTEMERMLTAYLELHPASLDMLYSFAGVLFAQGKVNEAKMEIEKILIFEPKHENALELKVLIEQARKSSVPAGLR